MKAFIIIAVVVVAVVGVVAVLAKGVKDVLLKEAKQVDVITMKSIANFFNQPDVLAELQKNKDFLAAAVKKDVVVNGEKKIHVVAVLYDRQKGEVVSLDNALNLLSSRLDEGLLSAFGSNNMLTLQ